MLKEICNNDVILREITFLIIKEKRKQTSLVGIA